MSTTLEEKLAPQSQSGGRASCTTKQLLERWGVCLPLGALDACVINSHQKETWLKVGKDSWELVSTVKL